MNIREQLENLEEDMLCPLAILCKNSKGRKKEECESDVRTCFQRDRDRIIHSRAFRRLKHKTQVFLSPTKDHYRTRMTHSLEVSQIARTIGKALRLNEDLIEAIALGHDLGHTPYGHAGEKALNNVYKGGFKHNEQSLRVVDVVEKDYEGLNLTWEVRDGILNHKTQLMPNTLEGQVVRISDKIAYLHHDTEDAIRAGIIKEDDIPMEFRKSLGDTPRKRLDFIIKNVIYNSIGSKEIILDDKVKDEMYKLREYMFNHVYSNNIAKTEEGKAINVIENLYDFYIKNPNKMTKLYYDNIDKNGLEKTVIDYISGMTDSYAIEKYVSINIPKSWNKD